MINTDKTMEEVRRIKEECSRERLARTPEEQKRHSEKVMKLAEEMLGRKIPVADYSRSARKAAKEELAQV
jgi:hypothetical protein